MAPLKERCQPERVIRGLYPVEEGSSGNVIIGVKPGMAVTVALPSFILL